MQKEQLKQSIKTKFSSLGLSDAVVNSLVEQYADKELSEEDLDKALDGYMPLLKAIQGDGDRIRGLNKKIEELEGKVKTKADVKPSSNVSTNSSISATNPKDVSDSDYSQEILELKKELQELRAKSQEFTRQQTLRSRGQELQSILSSLPEEYRKGYTRIDVASLSEEDYNTLKDEVRQEVKAIGDDLKLKGVQFTSPLYKNNTLSDISKKDQELIDEVVDKLTL